MTYNEKKELANRLLVFLDGKGYVTSHRIYTAMGMKNKGIPIRKILFKLRTLGVVSKIGTKAFRWKLENRDWDKDHPFVPFNPLSDLSNSKEDNMPISITLSRDIVAEFSGICKRCGEPIKSEESIIEKWTTSKGDPVLSSQGHIIYVHKGCKKVEDAPSIETKHDTNGQASKLLVADLMQDVGTLNSTIIKLAERIEELEKTRPPRVIEIIQPDKKKVTVKGHVHEIFEQLMFHLQAGDHVLIVGPKGCGKTEIAKHVANSLKLPFGTQNLSGGITEGKLFGRVVPDINTGKNVYHPTEFIKLFEETGGVFLLDELDNGDPNVLVALNGMLGNGMIALERTKNPVAKKHDKFYCIAAANTWGTGADRQYVGRNQLDAAFLERFVALPMGYDKELEQHLCGDFPELLERYWKYRDNVVKNKLERTVSTRQLCRAKNWLKLGKDLAYCESILFSGWREDEIKKTKGGY